MQHYMKQLLPALPGYRVMFATGTVPKGGGMVEPYVDYSDVAMWLIVTPLDQLTPTAEAPSNGPQVVPLISARHGTYGTLEDATTMEGYVRVVGPNEDPMQYMNDVQEVAEDLVAAEEAGEDEGESEGEGSPSAGPANRIN